MASQVNAFCILDNINFNAFNLLNIYRLKSENTKDFSNFPFL